MEDAIAAAGIVDNIPFWHTDLMAATSFSFWITFLTLTNKRANSSHMRFHSYSSSLPAGTIYKSPAKPQRASSTVPG